MARNESEAMGVGVLPLGWEGVGVSVRAREWECVRLEHAVGEAEAQSVVETLWEALTLALLEGLGSRAVGVVREDGVGGAVAVGCAPEGEDVGEPSSGVKEMEGEGEEEGVERELTVLPRPLLSRDTVVRAEGVRVRLVLVESVDCGEAVKAGESVPGRPRVVPVGDWVTEEATEAVGLGLLLRVMEAEGEEEMEGEGELLPPPTPPPPPALIVEDTDGDALEVMDARALLLAVPRSTVRVPEGVGVLEVTGEAESMCSAVAVAGTEGEAAPRGLRVACRPPRLAVWEALPLARLRVPVGEGVRLAPGVWEEEKVAEPEAVTLGEWETLGVMLPLPLTLALAPPLGLLVLMSL